MGLSAKHFWGLLHRFRLLLIGAVAASAYLIFIWDLRNSSYLADPLLATFLQMAASLIAFTFAANAMIRFRGTHDRISLILAFGFILAGLIEAGSSYDFLPRNAGHQSRRRTRFRLVGWPGARFSASFCLRRCWWNADSPLSREPAKEIAGATLIVGVAAYLTSVFYFMVPNPPKIHPGAVIPRPWDLLPAAIYVLATIGYRLAPAPGAMPHSTAPCLSPPVLNVICHVTIAESQRVLDGPFTLAHVLMVSSYVVVLGGTLLDNAQLFEQVSHMAASDSLTGLANHRQLLEVLENEIERSRRTRRSFALLLFDLDDLKKINDKYGHLTGSRAIKRLGNALRSNSRTIDTAARYGGDEFAVILPEIGEEEAEPRRHAHLRTPGE